MFNHRPATLSRNGIVCAPHYLAAQAGLRLLQAGGNAVDAAIAASATLNVVYPILCGTGGDLFMLIWDAQSGSLHALDAAGRAGSRASIEAVRAAGHDLTLHMAGNRLQLFGRKPAPIQVTYLGYCSTTGVETIDYPNR